MKIIFIFLVLACIGSVNHAQTSTKDDAVIRAANAFFNSWNKHDFSDMATYTTDDINVIINTGALWQGRNEVQEKHQNAHKTIMKATSFTPQHPVSIRFIKPDVAVINMVAKIGTFYPPDGIDHGNNAVGNEDVMITLVEINKNNKWLISAIQGTPVFRGGVGATREVPVSK